MICFGFTIISSYFLIVLFLLKAIWVFYNDVHHGFTMNEKIISVLFECEFLSLFNKHNFSFARRFQFSKETFFELHRPRVFRIVLYKKLKHILNNVSAIVWFIIWWTERRWSSMFSADPEMNWRILKTINATVFV